MGQAAEKLRSGKGNPPPLALFCDAGRVCGGKMWIDPDLPEVSYLPKARHAALLARLTTEEHSGWGRVGTQLVCPECYNSIPKGSNPSQNLLQSASKYVNCEHCATSVLSADAHWQQYLGEWACKPAPVQPTQQPVAESILQEADRLVNVDRRSDYGHPLDDYTRTAALWSALLAHKLKEPITPEEATLCMTAVKLSREVNKHKRDNLVDVAGYAKCTDEIHNERGRREGAK